jgi:4-hydroxybenzoate polyprenyltransferase
MWLLTGLGFVINDILDYRKDAAAGVDRPIARGVLSRKIALVLSGAMALAVFALSTWVGSDGSVLAATGLALILYTPLAKRLPLFKGLFVATLCIAPLYYGSLICHAHYVWPLYLFMTAFVVGREALMDADELRGDLRAGLITVAAILGCDRTKRIGIGIMAMSLAGTCVVAGGWFARTAAVTSLLSLLLIFGWPRLNDTKRIELSRLPMLAAVLAIACS